jgi:hypothetical protein
VWEIGTLSHCWWESKMGWLWEKHWINPPKAKHRITMLPSNSIPSAHTPKFELGCYCNSEDNTPKNCCFVTLRGPLRIQAPSFPVSPCPSTRTDSLQSSPTCLKFRPTKEKAIPSVSSLSFY